MVNPVEVRNLCFSYGSNTVVTDVSFNLQQGELLMMLGPNGSGKSTIFRCVLGLDSRYKGNIFLEGESIRNKKPEAMARLVAYVPQVHYPVFNYTVMDMVLMGTSAGEKKWVLPGKRQKAAAEDALAKINILDFQNRNFRELSGGEQQMVLIARALAQKTRILVMDEPTNNLDYGNQLRLLSTICGLCKQGYSILLSSHNPDHAFQFANRILILYNKQLAAEGTPADVLTPELFYTLYGVKVRVLNDEQGVIRSVPVLD